MLHLIHTLLTVILPLCTSTHPETYTSKQTYPYLTSSIPPKKAAQVFR